MTSIRKTCSLAISEMKRKEMRYGPMVWLEEGPGPRIKRSLSDFMSAIFYSLYDKKGKQTYKARRYQKRENRFSLQGKLMFTSCVFGLQLSLETLLKEEVMLSVVLDGTGFVDHTLESLHGDV